MMPSYSRVHANKSGFNQDTATREPLPSSLRGEYTAGVSVYACLYGEVVRMGNDVRACIGLEYIAT